MAETASGKLVDIGPTTLYVEDSGTGVPLVLVHGGTMTSAAYKDAAVQLSADFRVIAFDDRGHGQSPVSDQPLTYANTADDVALLIDELGLDRPFIGGWSDGGQVAIEFGLRHPGKARGLLVGAAYTDFQSESSKEMIKSLFCANDDGSSDFERFERTRRPFASFLKALHNTSDDQWKSVLQATTTMCLDYPGLLQEQVRLIEDSAIVIHADRDQLIPIEEPLRLFDWITGSELAILPGCDHFNGAGPLFWSVVADYVRRHS